MTISMCAPELWRLEGMAQCQRSRSSGRPVHDFGPIDLIIVDELCKLRARIHIDRDRSWIRDKIMMIAKR